MFIGFDSREFKGADFVKRHMIFNNSNPTIVKATINFRFIDKSEGEIILEFLTILTTLSVSL